MNEKSARITDPDKSPSPAQIETWLGKEANRYWNHLIQWIDQKYPNVFTPEWLFGGKKHGWVLRYKKGKSFCTFIPEKNRFVIQLIFGAEGRLKMKTIRDELSAQTRKDYDEATTYHDGKWLLLTVDGDKIVNDVERLLAVKRRPKKQKQKCLTSFFIRKYENL
jgi:hypothetical protein